VDLKEIVIIGGPNGAGKTTLARVLLREFLELHPYLNADEITRELRPEDVESAAFAAGRQMIEKMRVLVVEGQSFAFETTCSGKSYLRLLERCKQEGWRITLLYFWLPTPEMTIARVARRVSQGGHDIPPEVIVRRYYAGIANMRDFYLPLADEAEISDNTDRSRLLVAEKREGRAPYIHDLARWARIQGVAG
jgi:predicted ABC-type ATPase